MASQLLRELCVALDAKQKAGNRSCPPFNPTKQKTRPISARQTIQIFPS
jgi:hypothetical protein